MREAKNFKGGGLEPRYEIEAKIPDVSALENLKMSRVYEKKSAPDPDPEIEVESEEPVNLIGPFLGPGD